MNTLNYLSLFGAADVVRAGGMIPDGSVIVAPAGAIETANPWSDVVAVERHCDSSQWRVKYNDGTYVYHLVVARDGCREILDRNGEPAGFEVVGTNRKVL